MTYENNFEIKNDLRIYLIQLDLLCQFSKIVIK